MSSCPACAASTEEGFRYCPVCGVDLRLPDSPTGTRPARDVSPSPASSGAAGPSSPASGPRQPRQLERFAPGTLLAGRYRIVGLLGRGGMGEVYRADDLRLEHPVALKFLSRTLASDPKRLERLYAEVRTARQVSHPSVCRVWDVGEADGQHFLSMEFVDGENLASLLRRIGRFPADKARHVARQLAEGLAAAHAKGLLHRDLKPANVMLDGQGQVRLTDFGLAGLAEAFSLEDVRSGTPSYMSPEQLAGREVSVRSDVYALGLLIYELVTGRRAFEGKGFAELARKHRDERPIDPGILVPDLDPALERTILACLEKEPRKRPASALAVAAMLAGRDPLEAAIAAGETPSPELVAAAGERAGLTPRAAWLCLAIAATGVLAFPALWARHHLLARVPAEKSPAALEDRARELVRRLAPEALDQAQGLELDLDGLAYLRQRSAEAPELLQTLGAGEPPLAFFWYRQGPRPLAARNPGGRVSAADPPLEVAGMAGASYDLRGRLLSFYCVPPQLEKREPASGAGGGGSAPASDVPDWGPLFEEARLDPARLGEVEPSWTPPFFADARYAWEGRWPAQPELVLRVEAASYRGRPAWFEVKAPWARPEREQASSLTDTERRIQALYIVLLVALTASSCVLAYRNISLGRGDRRGAFRLALTLFAFAVAAWTLRANHTAEAATEIAAFVKGVGVSLLVAALMWLFYLALEPYVRRLRPWTLVSWTRVLSGGVRDPVVGRDVLVGLAFGAVLAVVSVGVRALAVANGMPDRPEPFEIAALASPRMLLCYVLASPVNATLGGLSLLLLFVVLRLVTRRDWIAGLLVVVFLVSADLAQAGTGGRHLWLLLPLSAFAWAWFVALMLRLGVLAAITAVWTANMLFAPGLLYASDWRGSAVYTVIPLLLVTAALAFRSAVGGRLGLERYGSAEAVSSGRTP